MQVSRAPPPGADHGTGGSEAAAGDDDRVGRPAARGEAVGARVVSDPDVPAAGGRRAGHPDVPAQVHQDAAAGLRRDALRGAVRGQGLGGGTEIEHHAVRDPGGLPQRIEVHGLPARGGCHGDPGRPGAPADLRIVPVVAEPDQGLAAGRVHVAVRGPGGGQRDGQGLGEQRADRDRAAGGPVEPGQLGIGPEPGAGGVDGGQLGGQHGRGGVAGARIGDQHRRCGTQRRKGHPSRAGVVPGRGDNGPGRPGSGRGRPGAGPGRERGNFVRARPITAGLQRTAGLQPAAGQDVGHLRVPHPPPVDPLEMVWTGLGAGAGAGGALGGASVGDGGGALGWAAAGGGGALGGALWAFFFLAAARCVCVGLGLGLGVWVGEAAGDGLTAVWLLAVWAGALRANRTAKAAAAMALSWVVRQVSLDRRRRPSVRLLPPGSSRRRVGSPGGEIPGWDVLLPGHSWSGRCGGYLSRMGRHCTGSQVKSPPRMAQDTFRRRWPGRPGPHSGPPGRPSAGRMPSRLSSCGTCR